MYSNLHYRALENIWTVVFWSPALFLTLKRVPNKSVLQVTWAYGLAQLEAIPHHSIPHLHGSPHNNIHELLAHVISNPPGDWGSTQDIKLPKLIPIVPTDTAVLIFTIQT